LPARHTLWRERWNGAEPERAWSLAARERFARHKADLTGAHTVISPSRFLARRFEQAGFAPRGECEILQARATRAAVLPRAARPARAAARRLRRRDLLLEGRARARARLPAPRGEPVELACTAPRLVPRLRAALRAEARAGRALRGPVRAADGRRVLAGLDVLVLPSVWYENMPDHDPRGAPARHPGRRRPTLGGMAEAVEHGVTGLTSRAATTRAWPTCALARARPRALRPPAAERAGACRRWRRRRPARALYAAGWTRSMWSLRTAARGAVVFVVGTLLLVSARRCSSCRSGCS
jgi:hypothetical protein